MKRFNPAQPTTDLLWTEYSGLRTLLFRLRHTLPIPHPIASIHADLLPDAGMSASTVRVRNLGEALHWGATVSVCLDEPDEPIHDKRVFFMTFPTNMITPSELTGSFQLPPDSQYWGSLRAWYREASALETQIARLLEVINRHVACHTTVESMRDTWPELLPYLIMAGTEPDSGAALRRSVLRGVASQRRQYLAWITRNKLQHRRDKQEVMEALATASLIDGNQGISAWVSYNIC